VADQELKKGSKTGGGKKFAGSGIIKAKKKGVSEDWTSFLQTRGERLIRESNFGGEMQA